MPELSIIIVSYNTAATTVACLQSIFTAIDKYPIDLEVLVVDNASNDDSVSAIRALKNKNIILLPQKENLGFGKANNLALAKATGKYILFLNSDTLVLELNFPEIIAYLQRHEAVGVMTVKVQLQNGAIDPASHRGYPTLWRSFCYFSKLEAITRSIPLLNRLFGGYHLTHLDLSSIHDIESPSGAFFLTRRSILERIGGFDESFFMYGEDLDLAKRIKEDGYTIVYYPKQSITHLKGVSGIKNTDEKRSTQTSRYFYEAMKIFYDKHYAAQYPAWINRLVYFAIQYKSK